MTTELLLRENELRRDPPSLRVPSFPLSDGPFGLVVLADDPCEAGNGGAGPHVPNKYLHARYYDPQLGVFLSPDRLHPARPGVGANRYSYGFGNPINGTDRSGLEMSCGRMEVGTWTTLTYELFHNPGTGQYASELIDSKTHFTMECTWFENGPGEGWERTLEERQLREDLIDRNTDGTSTGGDDSGVVPCKGCDGGDSGQGDGGDDEKGRTRKVSIVAPDGTQFDNFDDYWAHYYSTDAGYSEENGWSNYEVNNAGYFWAGVTGADYAAIWLSPWVKGANAIRASIMWGGQLMFWHSTPTWSDRYSRVHWRPVPVRRPRPEPPGPFSTPPTPAE